MAKADKALEAFLISVEGKAYHMARFASGSDHDALDIVQEAMTRFVKSYARKPAEEWKPLFYRVLRNLCVDERRKEGFRSKFKGFLGMFRSDGAGEDEPDPIQSAPDPTGRTPEEMASDGDFLRDLRQALDGLSPRQREVFLLRAWEGLSVAETATAMECSEGAVKTHYFRAVEALRAELGGRWP